MSRPLPSSHFGALGRRVSMLGLGTWQFSGCQQFNGFRTGWPPISNHRASAIVRAAQSAGIDFFDTSDFYADGAVEVLVGRSLDPQKQAVVATKWGLVQRYDQNQKEIRRDFSPDSLERALSASLLRLERKHIDLYQLHGPEKADLASRALWSRLEKFRESGMIRAIGVSVRTRSFDQEYLSMINHNPIISAVQLPVTLIHPHFLNAARELKRGGKFVIGRSPLFHGLLVKDDKLGVDDPRSDFLTDKIRATLDTVRRRLYKLAKALNRPPAPTVLGLLSASGLTDVVLFGATTITQVTENLALATVAQFDRFTANEYLEQLTKDLVAP